MQYLLFVDDTGFNKNKNSRKLNDEKISMVGCLVPASEIEQLAGELNFHLSELKELYDADEYHFTDICNHKNQFEGIDGFDALSMIQIFAEIIKEYDIKIVTQTITSEMLEKNGDLIAGVDAIARECGFSSISEAQKNESRALILNILNAKKYVESLSGDNEIAAVFCDEGLRKNNAETKIKLGGKDVEIDFCSSKEFPYLQVADFAAWALTRSKLNLEKSQNKEMKDFDLMTMRILETIVSNYINISHVTTNAGCGINVDETYDEIVK